MSATMPLLSWYPLCRRCETPIPSPAVYDRRCPAFEHSPDETHLLSEEDACQLFFGVPLAVRRAQLAAEQDRKRTAYDRVRREFEVRMGMLARDAERLTPAVSPAAGVTEKPADPSSRVWYAQGMARPSWGQQSFSHGRCKP